MKRIAIFVSGSGTNMENLIRQMQAGEIPAVPCLVISDNSEAAAIGKARKLKVPVEVIPRKNYSDKSIFEKEIQKQLNAYRVEFIVLAGFMRLLSSDFVRGWKNKLINVHPSLLPAFPGAHGIRDAFNAKVKETGVTIHYVDEGVDTGPVILQRKVTIDPNETLETLETKIHAVEYEIYPEALKEIISGKP
ncbi:MAG: phosphoribosylglycinamide formyltransferase [Candidatus Omnitrophica bacterium]|nr:phosphoribosylglycinamide formyltransferase [Candidatus Omnitrophota bacterium]